MSEQANSIKLPATPRLSATVIPVRASAECGLEVLVIDRARNLRVLPGFTVFPGGVLDTTDVKVAERWCSLAGGFAPAVQALLPQGGACDIDWTAAAWPDAAVSCVEQVLLTLLSTGLRELSEEVGWCPLPRARWTSDELAALRTGMSDVWASAVHNLGLRFPVRYFGRRVTPEALRHRFDTHYFVARCDDAEDVQIARAEVARAYWIAPQQLLDQATGPGALTLLAPPTIDALAALVEAGQLEALWDAAGMPPQVNDPARVELLRRLSGQS